MIKAVFFDFDGVLVLPGHACEAICRALAKRHGLPYEKLEPAFHGYATHMLLEPRRYESIIDGLNESMDSRLTVQDILEAAKMVKPNSGMIALVNKLRQRGLITGIITDNNVERIEVLRQPCKLDDFYPLVVSAEVGFVKGHNAEIFSIALAKAGVRPDEALFVDNREANLSIPKKLGMHTYWHDHRTNDVGAFRTKLVELGCLNGTP